jgi:hypothetical protein
MSTGLDWIAEDAELAGVREFSLRSGEARCMVRLSYWGGGIEAALDPGEAARCRQLVGQRVRARGALTVAENRFGVRVSFRVAEIGAVPAGRGRAQS